VESILKLKPASSKGTYLKALSLSTTMGPGVSIDPMDVRSTLRPYKDEKEVRDSRHCSV
jgi:large subunit ribosomal protein L1